MGKLWCGDQKTLVRHHLALTGLPRIDERAGYQHFLAEKTLDKGLSPSDLNKALGFPRAALDLEKYNPDQPRVPAGSGRDSHQMTQDRWDRAGDRVPKPFDLSERLTTQALIAQSSANLPLSLRSQRLATSSILQLTGMKQLTTNRAY